MQVLSNNKDPLYVLGYEEIDKEISINYLDQSIKSVIPNNHHNILAINSKMEKQVLDSCKDIDKYKRLLFQCRSMLILDISMIIFNINILLKNDLILSNMLVELLFILFWLIDIIQKLTLIKRFNKIQTLYKKYLFYIENKEFFGYDSEYNKLDSCDCYITLSNIDDFTYEDLKKLSLQLKKD